MPVIFAPVVLETFPDGASLGSRLGWSGPRNDGATPPMLKEFADGVARYRDGSVPYIKIFDGGLVDNHGLSSFTMARLSANTPYGPSTPRQATNIRRMLFLVVDGGVALRRLGADRRRTDRARDRDGGCRPPSVRACGRATPPSTARCWSGVIRL
jgi:NTE family protein